MKSSERKNAIVSLSRDQVYAFRLRQHHLIARAQLKSLERVVRDICGVHAQLMSSAHIALWARVRGVTQEYIEQELFQKKSLIKTWCMRGTVHLLPAKDLVVYLDAVGPSRILEEQRWLARYGVDRIRSEEIICAAVDCLKAGALTRQELTEEVVRRLGQWAKPWVQHSWGGVLKQACLKGLICFGPSRKQEVTFVRLDQWLPGFESKRSLTTEPGTRLLRYYLRSYGPATIQDFSAWSGIPIRDIGSLRERIGDGLLEIDAEKTKGLMFRDDLKIARKTTLPTPIVRLLPSFDVYMLGHRDKSHLVDDGQYKKVYRKAGWLSPVILVDGQVAGIWSYKQHSGCLHIYAEMFKSISQKTRSGIKTEATSLARFLGVVPKITFS